MSGFPSRRAGLRRWIADLNPVFAAITIFIVSGVAGLSAPVRAETISSALSRAYVGNPDLNQQRAAGRASDEGVSRAVAGYRPQVAATGSYGYNQINGQLSGLNVRGPSYPTTAGLTVTQNVFNGFQTLNGVRQAESGVLQSRETIRNTEQNTLQNGATAYMNVLRDTAILDLNKNNITVLEEQLRQTRDRFKVGEVTRTDVAQAQSSLSTARSNYFTAEANLQNSVAVYRQIIGVEPSRLEAARPIDALLPHALPQAITLALSEHPAIQAALHNVDAAAAQVKLNEGQLYPTVNVVGNIENDTAYSGVPSAHFWNGSILGQLSVPIYSGGATFALVRQSKELLSQAQLQADVQRDTVRAAVVSSWGQLETAKAVIRSSQAAVKSAEIALDGVREEAKVGQRTTLDVLIAQQTLLNARVNLVSAQRDRVVASYTVMAAVGQLSAANLSLDVVQYDPTIHYTQVRDKWIGLRTPDGR
jgi:outer membrane protein